MRNVFFVLLIGLLFSCGGTDEWEQVQERVKQLEVISSSLTAAIYSDFATCANSGDTLDPFINKVCNIAKAANSEALVQLKSELSVYSQYLQGQVDTINSNLVNQQASIDAANATLVTVNSTLSTLGTRMTNAENAITALQSLTSTINGTLAGNLITIDIGSENVSSGPQYETVLRRNDKKRFNGYVQAFGTSQGLPSNPLNASNGSSTVTVSLTAHGYLAGDLIYMESLTGSRGFSNGHVYGEFVVQTAAANSFTLTLGATATSGGSLGGSAGTVKKVIGRGMGTLWKSQDASDVAVRQAVGSKRYNFIIRRRASDVSNDTGELCYSKSDNAATFATINASPENGSATIACK